MKVILSCFLLLLLPFFSAAIPVPDDGDDLPPFTVIAARSGSPIHLQEMTASGLSFWLGGQTSSYCPGDIVPNCPPGDRTVFAPGGSAMVPAPFLYSPVNLPLHCI